MVTDGSIGRSGGAHGRKSVAKTDITAAKVARGRRHGGIPPDSGSIGDLAQALRRLKAKAGEPSYRALAIKARYSNTSLSRAADGRSLPPLEVVMAYARACDADASEQTTIEALWWAAQDARRSGRLGSPGGQVGAVPQSAAIRPDDVVAPDEPITGAMPTAGGRRIPSMVPALPERFIERPGLMADLLAEILREGRRPGTPPITVEGPGGYGKTTALAAVCHLYAEAILGRFPGGMLWAEIGRSTSGAALVAAIDPLLEALSESADPGVPESGILTLPRPANPRAAGVRLGRLLDRAGPVLLVLDDIWTPEQLEPFLLGGRDCLRVVVTRDRDIVGAAPTVQVDELTPQEAIELLGATIENLPGEAVDRLLAWTERWPLLISLVNGNLSERISQGGSPAEAAEDLLDLLGREGPQAVDNPRARKRSIEQSVEASVGMLGRIERRCFRQLAVFPEGLAIPARQIEMLWRAGAGLDARRSRLLMTKLIHLRLVHGERSRPQGDRPGPAGERPELSLRLHEVVRSYLVHRHADELPGWHAALLDAYRPMPARGHHSGSGWWTLPRDNTYLWRHLAYHLGAAGLRVELAATVCHPLWIVGKIQALGSIAPLEQDLEIVGSPTAVTLSRILGRDADLLGPMDPPQGLAATLASRIQGKLPAKFLEDIRRTAGGCWIEPEWALPDRNAEFVRAFTDHLADVCTVAFSPEAQFLLSVGDDGLRLRPLMSGLPGHDSRVHDAVSFVVTPGNGLADSADTAVFDPRGTLVVVTPAVPLPGAVPAPAAETLPIRVRAASHRCPGRPHAIAVSPDGRRVATADDADTIDVWTASSGRRERVFGGSTRMRALAFAPDGLMLAGAGDDGRIRLWVLDEGAEPGRPKEQEHLIRPGRILRGHVGSVRAVAFSPRSTDLLASAGDDETVRLWHLDGRPPDVLSGHRGGVRTVCISPNETLVASGGDDRTIMLWDIASRKIAGTLPDQPGRVAACAFSPDGAQLASAVGATVRLWDVAAALVGPPNGDRSLTGGRLPAADQTSCSDIDFSPDGQSMVTTSVDGPVLRWDVATGGCTPLALWHAGRVLAVRHCPARSVLVTVGADQTARVWELPDGPLRHVLQHAADVTGCALAHDGETLATTCRDRVLRLWNVQTGEQIAELATKDDLCAVSYSADGNRMATADADGNVHLRTADGQVRQTLVGHVGLIAACVFSPDGTTLATAGADRTLRIWDVRTGRLDAVLRGHTGAVRSCAFSPDGRMIVSIDDSAVRIVSRHSGRCLAALRVARSLNACAWHPQGRLIGLAGEAGPYLMRRAGESW